MYIIPFKKRDKCRKCVLTFYRSKIKAVFLVSPVCEVLL